MIARIAALLGFQLAGEALARSLLPALPGPVIGMALLLAALLAMPRLAAALRPLAEGILAHLGLLFVPAGVGVLGHIAILGDDGPALVLALVASTALAMAVAALTFVTVARLVGAAEGAGDD